MRYRLLMIWLHWTVAHAAAFCTLAGWMMLYRWFRSEAHETRQNDVAALVAGVFAILLFLGCLQQSIVRSAGWRAPLWAICSMLGFLVGGFMAMLAAGIPWELAGRFSIPYPWSAVLFLAATSLTWGSVFGLIQFLAVQASLRRQLAWILANSLALFAATSSLFLFRRFPLFSDDETLAVHAVLGAGYGLITGGALCLLLCRDQQRHGRDSAPGSQ